MNSVGLITEYNPFHNGHLYHLQQSLAVTGADVAIVVMSGNFVQRGEPAIIDKYTRCRAAVNAGANLVVELPSVYALSSAEMFADGAIKTLAALKADSVVFGSECGDISLLNEIADILIQEPDSYRESLKAALSAGKTFPQARQEALAICSFSDCPQDILSSPNNILGIEYIKAIKKRNLSLKSHTITRQGSSYHDTDITDVLSSANAIRTALSEGRQFSHIQSSVPECMYQLFDNSFPVFLDDFSSILNYRLLEIFMQCHNDKNKIAENLSAYADISTELGSRIATGFTGHQTFSELILEVKSRQYTYSRICRCLMHILLDIKKEKLLRFQQEEVPYVRILGFDKKGQEYLSSIKKKMTVPLITKTAGYGDMLREDIFCADVYNQTVWQKYGTVIKDEFRQGVYRS
jgi:predicted nucleotidyltransferase